MADVGSANIRITANDQSARTVIRNFATNFNRQGQALAQSVSSGMQGAVTAAQQAASATTNVARTASEIGPSFERASNSIGNAVRRSIIAPFKSAIGIVKQYGGALGVMSAGGLISAGVNRLSVIEDARIALKVMLGDAQKVEIFMADVLAFAKTTPFAFPQLATAAKNMVAFGMDTKKVIPTLKAVGDAAAASGRGADGLDMLTTAFGQMQVSSKLSLGPIRSLEQVGVPAVTILANKFGLSADEMEKKITGGAINSKEAIDMLVDGIANGTKGIAGETKKMGGVMEEMKNSWRGSVDSLKSSISSTMANIMEPAIPHIRAFMRWFGDQFKKLPDLIFGAVKKINGQSNGLKEFGKALIPIFNNLLQVIGAIAPMVGTVLAGAIGVLMKTLPPVLKFLTDIIAAITKWEGFVPIVAGLVTALITYKTVVTGIATAQKVMNAVQKASILLYNAHRAAMIAFALYGGGVKGIIQGMAAAMRILNITMLANPIGIVIALIAGLVAGIVIAYKKSEKFRKIVDGLWKALKEGWEKIAGIFGPPLQNAVSKVKEQWQKDTEDMKSLWVKVKTQWEKDTEDVKEKLGPPLQNAVKKVKDQWEKDTEDVKSQWAKVKTQWNSDLEDLKSLWSRVSNKWKEDTDDVKKKFTEDLPNAWNRMREAIRNSPDTVPQKLDELKKSFNSWFEQTKKDIPVKLAGWGSAFKSWLEAQNEENKRQYAEWGRSLHDWFGSMPDKIKTKISEWWNPIGEWFSSLPEKTSAKLSEWWQSIGTWIGTKYNDWKQSLENWWIGIGEWFSTLPSRTKAKLDEWWTSIKTWFIDTKNNWSQSLEDWWNGISLWFSTLPSRSKAKLDEWWLSIREWFTNTKEKWNQSLEEWWQTIKAWFSGLHFKPEVQDAGKNIVKKVKEGTNMEKQNFMDNIGKIVVDAISFMLAAAVIIAFAAGRELIKRLIDGLTSMKSALGAKWEEIKSDMLRIVQNIDLYQAGKDAIQGFINGIGDMIGSVRTKVGNVVDALKEKLAAKLQLGSPSKLLKQYGEWTFEGFVIGADNMLGEIRNIAGKAAEAIVPKPNITPQSSITGALRNLGNPFMNFSSANTGAVQAAGGPYVFQVNLNGKKIAEETYEDIQDLQNKAEARARRARGEVR
ncbi:tape measure protein [Cytobacillus depressus]|uniref:Tape measure protein n=1 Tax=Cytobacillus depressus TaxID=1602942 RepID=A0A6L3UXL0_9BACI|nr:tape measure protein [Cytobacillus depressus]KAB2328925.1 tape measure protein [Cytobacillus depressus]